MPGASGLGRAARAVEQGTHVAPTHVPTFAEMAEQWFANQRTLRPNTVEYYRRHLDNHLLPELGRLKLNQIDVDTVERFRDRLLADTAKQVGAVTVNKVLTTAAAVFTFAEKRKRCANNPAQLADRLKVSEEIVDEDGDVHRVSARPVSEEDILTAAEIQTLLKHAKAGLPYTLLLTAAATGCRHNELLALRWQDIDFEAGAIHVRRTLTWVRDGDGQGRVAKYYPPKTKAGRRRIPAPPELIQALRRWFLQSPFKAAGDLVFPTRTGKPRHHRTVRRDVLERTRIRAKVKKFTMHSLRHSFASSLLQGGASIAEVQKYMGHKTPAVTLNVYAHFLPTEDTGAVAAHVRRIFPNGPVSAPGAIRTHGPRIRNPVLYPPELRGRTVFSSTYRNGFPVSIHHCNGNCNGQAPAALVHKGSARVLGTGKGIVDCDTERPDELAANRDRKSNHRQENQAEG